jgi:hypothetical protein
MLSYFNSTILSDLNPRHETSLKKLCWDKHSSLFSMRMKKSFISESTGCFSAVVVFSTREENYKETIQRTKKKFITERKKEKTFFSRKKSFVFEERKEEKMDRATKQGSDSNKTFFVVI